MSARVTINTPCGCGDIHQAEAWTTAVAGLVVVNEQGLCAQQPIKDECWVITHLVSGLGLPRVFGSPEAAMACAAALDGVWDWTQCGRPDQIGRIVDLLHEFGGEQGPYRTYRGDLEVRNPAVTQ